MRTYDLKYHPPFLLMLSPYVLAHQLHAMKKKDMIAAISNMLVGIILSSYFVKKMYKSNIEIMDIDIMGIPIHTSQFAASSPHISYSPIFNKANIVHFLAWFIVLPYLNKYNNYSKSVLAYLNYIHLNYHKYI